MMEHPVLINRPVVVGPKGVKLCRSPEEVLSIFGRPLEADLTKENGAVVAAMADRVMTAKPQGRRT